MSQDLRNLLKSWETAHETAAKRIIGDDGREKIQIKAVSGAFEGVLQMALDGRPDEKRPHGRDFALDHFEFALTEYRAKNGTDLGFVLDEQACAELFEESFKLYNRYVFLLDIGDFHRVIRDTKRNMSLFRFVHSYAATEEDRLRQEKWWPYILRIHGLARVELALQQERYDEAQRTVAHTMQEIEKLQQIEAPEFHVERTRSITFLKNLEQKILESRPKTRLEELHEALEDAVGREDFERAAELRDEIKHIERH